MTLLFDKLQIYFVIHSLWMEHNFLHYIKARNFYSLWRHFTGVCKRIMLHYVLTCLHVWSKWCKSKNRISEEFHLMANKMNRKKNCSLFQTKEIILTIVVECSSISIIFFVFWFIVVSDIAWVVVKEELEVKKSEIE